MKTPDFWYNKRPVAADALALYPLSLVYSGVLRLLLKWQRCRKTAPESTPLIIVGNLTAGGAGKTPIVMTMTALLQSKGYKVALICKGYGGRIKSPTRVETQHSAEDVGDEALLLARLAPTWIGHNRHEAYSAAAASGADVIISDDGLQSRAIKGHLRLAVIDGVRGLGNGFLLPAGPVRQPLDLILPTLDACIQMGGDTPLDFTHRHATPPLVFQADFKLKVTETQRQAPALLAFAGLGLPDKFFDSLRAAGLKVVATASYPDHYAYTAKDWDELQKGAAKIGGQLITTTKDAVKIPTELRDKILVAEGEAVFRDLPPFSALIFGQLLRYKTPSC